MAHPLDGAVLRFNRAERHLAEADELIRVWAKGCVEAIVRDNNNNLRFEGWPTIPEMLPLAVSDATHNMRAALDYLIYELALKDSGKVQHGTQFLIEDVKVDPANKNRGFDARSKKCLVGLSQPHIDAIEALQPYNGVDWTKSLRDISNPDKHKRLCVLSKDGRPIGVRMIDSPIGRFDRLNVTPQGPTIERFDVEVDGSDTIAIAPPNPGKPSLMRTLRSIQTELCATLETFKSEF